MANYIITGVSSCLGREFTNTLSLNQENKIIATSRREVEFPTVLTSNVNYLPCIDLLKEEDIMLLVSVAKEIFNDKFSVINCSGYYGGQEPIQQTSICESNRIFESNFVTVYNLTRLLIPVMREKGGGHFVGFSCNSVMYNYPQMAPFTAAKSALESFFRSIANELYNENIYANSFRLATLLTDNEISHKPNGDHKQWLKLCEVVGYVEQFLNQKYQIQNGNAIRLYHYSDSFFNKSYFERIKREYNKI